jgi:hypothetical protein
MKPTSWLFMVVTVVVMIATVVAGRRDANAQGSGPDLRNPVAVVAEPFGTLAAIDQNLNAVFRVLLTAGDRSIVSDQDMGMGPNLSRPSDIAREANGTFVVVDENLNAVLRVDPTTGDRQVISGCVQTQDPCPVPLIGTGPPLGRLVSVAVEGATSLIVVDLEAKAVLRVALSTGDRTILSNANRGSGPNLDEPMGIAVQSNGTLALIDTALDAVVEVDPVTGDRRILSGCADVPDPCPVPLVGSGPSFMRPVDVAIQPDRTLAVLDVDLGAIVEVNPDTASRTIVSDATTGSGPVFLSPSGITADLNNRLFVVDPVRRAIIQVNPDSGERQIISQASTLNISPDTGIYTAFQAFDLVLIVEGAIDDVSIASATLNGTDITSILNSCGIEQRLTGGGVAIRCANANALLGLEPGRYRFDVLLNASVAGQGNTELRDTVFWYLLDEF